ncbi:hypothetical protein A1O1_06061 [Capronia coronata CBS 617.96]|uniref:MIT domain-containing protein n=1 Tax=Capronia coronata CBS 617.96 TaxID=1182541 RepID=W9XZM5_9EURO|nr:uncharacterized protein A1O1_06061 [Capronia coronata CBS 617.96]EXJ85693.1 hypothetical protein A1O1_06061 [Capronia coronata CBS 617.96]
MSALAASATYDRRASRSNLSTASSVNTIQKFASVTVRSVSQNAPLTRRSNSPNSTRSGAFHDRNDRSRSRSRPENRFEPRPQGHNLNINRWSHSTSSSVSAIDTEAIRARVNASSRRMSLASSSVSAASEGRAPESAMHSRPSSRSPARNARTASRHLRVDQSYGSRDISPVTGSPLTPTSMFNPSAGDFLGETWQSRKAVKPGDSVAMSIHYMSAGSQPRLEAADNAASQYASQRTRPSTHEILPEPQDERDAADPVTSTVSARGRGHRSPTQKTMLSKALGKANTAVLLDNAQNIEGAIEAYAEACDLLQQVLVRSSDLDDRKKLSAIRSTYSNRIAELHDLDDTFSGLMEKALPEDPPFDETNQSFFSSDGVEPDTASVLETVHIPPRQESLLPEIFGGESYLSESLNRGRLQIPSLVIPMETQYMPRPLSPRRTASPASGRDLSVPPASTTVTDLSNGTLHAREDSTESTSWLDTLEDGDSSSRSSRLSSIDFGIRQTHNLVGEIEAEFDAALDAAVDAAYDDSLAEEPTPRPDKNGQDFGGESSDPSAAFQPDLQPQSSLGSADLDFTREYNDGNSSDEEDRLLEEMTKGYTFDRFSFEDRSKSALPRQSDSSTFSGQTWASSFQSTTATNAGNLGTLAESHEPSPEDPPRPTPPAKDTGLTSPRQRALPPTPSAPLPAQSARGTVSTEKYGGLGLRERRFSGQSGKQLKIDTFTRRKSSSFPANPTGHAWILPGLEFSTDNRPKVPQSAPLDRSIMSMAINAQPVTSVASMASAESVQGESESPATPAMTQRRSQGSIDDSSVMPPPTVMRKNLSSSSLRRRNLSVATTEVNSESPNTPTSTSFVGETKKVVPPLPSAAAFGPHLLQTGGFYLFDDHLGSPTSPSPPRSPGAQSFAPRPEPLEPCPESSLLRPFWLMRCLYQTLVHPRGGYITTKLFIPRDIWRVRNVKLKAIDDKVSQCDLLTAALLKLGKVDTLDADAVLEELQLLEVVLDQVRVTLQKKLGSEVGFSGSSSLFKATGEDHDAPSTKANNTTAKSLASSWRKLRSKSSAPAVGHHHVQKDVAAHGLTMPSLPMTSSFSFHSSRSHLNRRTTPPLTPTQLTNVPPVHASYMSSLARLFDAVQVLDGIARQVEDPGLKCSSKTQVGLELGVKNAAEFFAFYVIRFVMTDLTLLLDKFLKRGTEWVLT